MSQNISTSSHRKFFALISDVDKGIFFDSIQDAEDWLNSKLPLYPHLQGAIYELKEVGSVVTQPVKFREV